MRGKTKLILILAVFALITVFGCVILSRNVNVQKMVNKSEQNKEEQNKEGSKQPDLKNGGSENSKTKDADVKKDNDQIQEDKDKEKKDYIKGRPLTQEEIDKQKEYEPDFPGEREAE